MNQRQAANLEKLRAFLLALPRGTAAHFNIESCEFCACGIARARQVIPGFHNFDDSPEFFGVSNTQGEDATGTTGTEDDYLFQNSIWHWNYDRKTGRAGIEEFADRAENVLQYYRSIGSIK